MYWNDLAVTQDQLALRIATAARQTPQPGLHLRAARTTQYEKLPK